uniref:uncharacterized protein n=1 Tax=Pristiophorus japonicus TaxID=55135 RepID=UPI00398E6B72
MGFNRKYWLIKWQLLYCVFPFCVLVSGQIRYSIPEELQLGAFVGNVASDLGLDVKELSARNFRIVPGPRKRYLDVNLNNGILFVKEKIDREQLCGSSLTCILPMEAVIENPLNVYRVEVAIRDVNDNAPSFPKSQIRLEISEVAATGARFPLECAHDPDVGTNSLQNYQLVGNQYFALDIETRNGDEKLPVLMLQRPLDREEVSSHRLELIAKDGGVPPRSSTAQIIIAVQDANDNSPVFSQSVSRVSLNENLLKGTLVIKLNATDLDDGSNGEIEYTFTRHTSAAVRELFGLDSKTGEIRVKGNLDYEENGAFEINVQAMDKGPTAVPVYCHVHVDIADVNDNSPEVLVTSLFSPVREDALPGTVIALISTTDKDSGENGQVRCQIPSDLPFKLNSPLKNYYKLLTREQLDRENISKHEVTITCSDSGSTPLSSNRSLQVEISDVNDNAPRFKQSSYTAYVTENNVVGASIFSVTASDPDFNQNARLSYSIPRQQVQGESVTTYLSINSVNGVIFSQRTFDYEELKSIQIQVQARDSGVPPLTSNVSVDVVILDQNDNAPVILHPLPEYGSTVMETLSRFAEPGYLVTKVSAIDADSGQNARLSYQILQATDPGLFTISPDTGEIWTIRGMVDKDATKQRLTIVVKDNGAPPLSASLSLSLSVVDGDTQLLSDVSSLTEDSGFASGLSYYLVISLGITSSIFLVVLIILAVKVHKSRTGLGLYSCCCCKSKNSLNGIQKASRNIQIPPNYVEVFGGDPLSQSFRYETYSTLDSTKRDSAFPHMCNSAALTYHVRGEYIEKGKSPQTSPSTNYRNIVNSEAGASLPALRNAVYCDWLKTNVAPFANQKLNGIIEQRCDVLKQLECFVLAMGFDEIYCLLKWQLLFCSWNLVSGQIRYSVPEELQLGAFVGNLAADLGLDVKQLSARNFRIVPGPRKQHFGVNLDNGILLVKEKIDRELLCGSSLGCGLTLEAVIDEPLNVYHVEVEIQDINDNAPHFPKGQFRLEISELAAPGARFPLESAYDPDVGTNSLQSYQLAPNQYFELDVQSRSEDGKLPVLVMERPLDREQQPTLQLLLTATDGGIPGRSGTAQIIIQVLDANDNMPTFSQSLYRVSLLENVPTGTLVVKVKATDLDEGSNGEIVYAFGSHASVKVRELFSVDHKTGEIRVKEHLDFETAKELEISVQAVDKGSFSVPVYCDVLVKIVDVNDNAPEVAVTSLSSSVPENVLPGTVIALISVTDSDVGENGNIHCQIPNSLPFKLDSTFKNYYRLLTRDLLDREMVSQYGITITCTDAGSPALTTNKNIQLKISDINDSAPRFSQTSYTAYVTENNAIGRSIYTVSAFDADLNQNAKLSYSILKTLSGDVPASDWLSINSDSGIISAERSFDYEELKRFQIQVQAVDAGVPPMSSRVSVDVVILDQNDNAPVILSPRPEYDSTAVETVSRSAEPGYLVTKVSAEDADSGPNARLSYQLAQATDSGLFTIAPDTGEIWTIRGVVDRDVTKQRLVILVKDNGIPPLTATINIILTFADSDAEILSEASSLSEDLGFPSDVSLYLVIALGTISTVFLVILVVLAVKVHRSRDIFNRHSCSLDRCCCLGSTHQHGIQKASINLQIPPNYVEVFGRDPLSQNFCYEVCSTSDKNSGNTFDSKSNPQRATASQMTLM